MEGEKSLSDIYNLIQSTNKNLCDKIEGVSNDLKILAENVNKEVKEVKQKVLILEAENNTLKERLQTIERTLRKNNVVFYGIEEIENETFEHLAYQIKNLLKEKLAVDPPIIEFTNIFRLGKASNKKRPILVKLLSYETKINILKNKTKLKGTGIFISEDLSKENREERNILVKNLKEARGKNKQASIRGNRIIIEGEAYTSEELQNNQNNLQTNGYYSPPAARKTTSEPSTPVTLNQSEQNLEKKREESIKETSEEINFEYSEEEEIGGQKRKLEDKEKKKEERQLQKIPSPTFKKHRTTRKNK